MLLLKWLHHSSKAKWSLSNLASMLRLNLFTYRDLRRWLENPFVTPPLVPPAEQLEKYRSQEKPHLHWPGIPRPSLPTSPKLFGPPC